MRRAVASVALDTIVKAADSRRGEVLVEFSTESIAGALRQDLVLRDQVRNPLAAIDRGLLFLHEQRAIILQQGLAVFRQAMTIRLRAASRGRRYTKQHYRGLEEHYRERAFQIHVMGHYAQIAQARRPHLVRDYFSLSRPAFVGRYIRGDAVSLERRTSEETYHRIATGLGNAAQEAIVTAPAEDSRLVLAGPGSGKTRVVVHRCAYLLRVLRTPARAILVVCFNRVAAWEVRSRLRALIGNDAGRVAIQTYHGLAARLLGVSFAGRERAGDRKLPLDSLIPDAVRLLRGEAELPGFEGDELRERLLEGYRHILVDEYQDIDESQFDLVAAIAGRTLEEGEGRLSILAVGDDDQNIYAWRGANIEFIRRFQDDYNAQITYLVENYRSSGRIIAAANRLIEANRDRMKTGHPIAVNASRRGEGSGEPVRLLEVQERGARVQGVVEDLAALLAQDPHGQHDQCAILGWSHDILDNVRGACDRMGIPVRRIVPPRKVPPLARIREVEAFLGALREGPGTTTNLADVRHLVRGQGNWIDLLHRILVAWGEQVGEGEFTAAAVREFAYEALAEEQLGTGLGQGVTLSTIHAAKGTEYDHVWVLGREWASHRSDADVEAERRALYVAMTRARKTLTLLRIAGTEQPDLDLLAGLVEPTRLPSQGTPSSVPDCTYELLGMEDLDLGYAGSFPSSEPIHRHLAGLQCGDRLRFDAAANRSIYLLAEGGERVARLSRERAERPGAELPAHAVAKVVAMVVRFDSDGDAAFRGRYKCGRWEVPLVEIEIPVRARRE
ncbi:MAG: ATP-dependent helicase [Planctomycetes bacterium]|nr:ATP-dependent helicase [Planctomycetota bacterium]